LRNGKDYVLWRKRLNDDYVDGDKRSHVVNYAINNFNFYKEYLKGINLEIWDNIPLLNKDEIQNALPEFRNFNCKKFYVATGGVTGKPATFFQSNNVWNKELAFVYDYFNRFGYKPNMRKASFRGGDFSNLNLKQVWKYNPIYNEMHFSPFHMNLNTIETYVSELNKKQPLYFHGYPSTFVMLAMLMQKKSLKLDYKPKAFFLISENYNEKDITFLKNFFDAKISSFYGHGERLVFAIASEDLKTYQPNLQYGYMELIDKKGYVIKENGKIGEIVGTSYDNYAMPLIRYKTGDYTYYTNYKTKTFAQIQGKWGQDALIGKNGEIITLTALNLHSSELDNFIRTQFRQMGKGIVELSVISLKRISDEEIGKIEQLLSKRVGYLILFKIKIVDKLNQNSRGKVPLIIKY